MNKSRPTQNKLARERARREKNQNKAARRMDAKMKKEHTPHSATGEDPDIAGIVPGPQPHPFGFDDEVEKVDEEKEGEGGQ